MDSTPPITPALWKQLLRWLNTPFVEGNQHLIAAIANLGPDTDSTQPCGLIMGGYDSVIQFLTAIVGSAPTPNSGYVLALAQQLHDAVCGVHSFSPHLVCAQVLEALLTASMAI